MWVRLVMVYLVTHTMSYTVEQVSSRMDRVTVNRIHSYTHTTFTGHWKTKDLAVGNHLYNHSHNHQTQINDRHFNIVKKSFPGDSWARIHRTS